MKGISIYLSTLIFTIMITISTNAKSIGKIYVFESGADGFNTKTVFYDDGKEVVAFDAQFTEVIAQQAINFLRTKTQNPIKYLVITHPNPDKFNGISVFKKAGATVIMSKLSAANMQEVHNYKKYYFVEMAKMFTNDNYPKISSPDLTFDETYDIVLTNGDKIKLKEFKKSAIATNQTVAFIETANALVVGDLIHNNVHAWLEGPIIKGLATYNGSNWIGVLKDLESNYPANATVYGGRGESGTLSNVVSEQINYLKKAEKLTNEYLSTINNDKSKVDYAQLQKVFEKAFPNYNLGYMIAYGGYGIVSSLK